MSDDTIDLTPTSYIHGVQIGNEWWPGLEVDTGIYPDLTDAWEHGNLQGGLDQLKFRIADDDGAKRLAQLEVTVWGRHRETGEELAFSVDLLQAPKAWQALLIRDRRLVLHPAHEDGTPCWGTLELTFDMGAEHRQIPADES